jgi:pyrroloquinoline quinone biosynthesis protein B
VSVEAVLLGIAQDAGVPQIGCDCPACAAARVDASLRQRAVSVGLIDTEARASWIIDATPDFREQYDALRALAPDCPLRGILLTHIHIGHYLGLAQLGKEALNARGMPVLCSPRATGFLKSNGPWSQLIENGNIILSPWAAHAPIALSPALTVTPLPVPHRAEFSDTVAFSIAGPRQTLFHCPDIDRWEAWAQDIRAVVDTHNVALLDATFFSGAELPGRDMSMIPHPLVTDTVARLRGTPAEVALIHLNHSNPLLRDTPERAWMREQSVSVGAQGQRWAL